MDGFGVITWWGFSPSIDLQEKGLVQAFEKISFVEEEGPLNILLLGAGDIRHILKTICQHGRHKKRQLNFYVLDNALEVYARDLLFLLLSLERQNRIGLQDKTEMFLELYGNLLVRDQTMSYVERMSSELIRFVTDFDYLEKKLSLVDLSLLKFKERDLLEGIFKFWKNPNRQVLDLAKCWDLRLRQYLGVRFDAIPNVFDWDLNMKLADRGARIIHTRHYTRWRHKGVAFEIREGNYSVSNKTMSSGMVFKQEGERHVRRGYWGDILVSPYIAFGIESEEESFFRKSNNDYMKSATDVAEYNIRSLFHELATGTRYRVGVEGGKEGAADDQVPPRQQATLTEITEDEEEEAAVEEPSGPALTSPPQNPLDQEYEPLETDFAKVYFLPMNCAGDLHKKNKYHKLFNVVYIGNTMAHNLNSDLAQTFADTARLLVETSKFMIELTKDQQEEFMKKVVSLATDIGCEPVAKPETTDNFMQFLFQRDAS